MSHAFRCEICDAESTWRIMRRGDVVTTWACAEDLSAVCEALQRDWEISELVVVHQQKLREWCEIATSLDAIAPRPKP